MRQIKSTQKYLSLSYKPLPFSTACNATRLYGSNYLSQEELGDVKFTYTSGGEGGWGHLSKEQRS